MGSLIPTGYPVISLIIRGESYCPLMQGKVDFSEEIGKGK